MSAAWLLHGGTVLDGRGGASEADVLVEGERIAAVLPRASEPGPRPAGTRALDCTGLLVAPGFVDAHTHDDTAAADPLRYEAKIRQGITASVAGQDGFGWAPLPAALRASLVRYWRPVNGLPVLADGTDLAHERMSGYFGALRGRAGIHVAALAGHANLRLAAAGWALRPVAPGEAQAMGRMLEEALEDGACGLSTGLTYVPACASDTEELIALARLLAPRGLPYASHLRAYGAGIFGAVEEALEIGRRAGCPVHLSHLHLSARAVWGQAERLLEVLDRAIAAGQAVTWDLYPYQAGSSVLYQYLPERMQDGGPEAFLRRLAGPEAAREMAADPAFAAADWSAYVISHTASGRRIGCTVAAAAAEMGAEPAEAIRRLLVGEDLDVGCIVHQTQEADDRLFLAHPACVAGSDGIFAAGRPHPRARGAFARFWRQFVGGDGEPGPHGPGSGAAGSGSGDRGSGSGTAAPGSGTGGPGSGTGGPGSGTAALGGGASAAFISAAAEAARRMAGAAARIHGLAGRGEVRPGGPADLAVLDGRRFADAATYQEPERMAVGMRHVFVAGTPVLLDGAFDARAAAGTALRP